MGIVQEDLLNIQLGNDFLNMASDFHQIQLKKRLRNPTINHSSPQGIQRKISKPAVKNPSNCPSKIHLLPPIKKTIHISLPKKYIKIEFSIPNSSAVVCHLCGPSRKIIDKKCDTFSIIISLVSFKSALI